MRSHQAARRATPSFAGAARAPTSALRALSASDASAAMESVGATFLPMLAGSMSMWMTRARGAKVASLPVTRSSKRTPTATSRSLSATAMLQALCQRKQLFRRARVDDAAADVEHWTLRLHNLFGGARDPFGGGLDLLLS